MGKIKTVSDHFNNPIPKAEKILSGPYDGKPTENTDKDFLNNFCKFK